MRMISRMDKKHGGARLNAGRKTEIQGEKMVRLTITVDPLTVRKLRVIGNGNKARGARIAAEMAYAKLQA